MCAELLLFGKLLFAHAVADFGLQSDAMARGKRGGSNPPPGQKPQVVWPYWLTAHSLIHGAAVYTVMGSVTWGMLNAALHWGIDFLKTRNVTGIHTDQTLHLVAMGATAILGSLVRLP